MFINHGIHIMTGIREIKVEKPSVIITVEEYEALKETIEVLSDKKLVQSIVKALSEQKGKRKPHKEVFSTK